jgi:hypothetical protein
MPKRAPVIPASDVPDWTVQDRDFKRYAEESP